MESFLAERARIAKSGILTSAGDAALPKTPESGFRVPEYILTERARRDGLPAYPPAPCPTSAGAPCSKKPSQIIFLGWAAVAICSNVHGLMRPDGSKVVAATGMASGVTLAYMAMALADCKPHVLMGATLPIFLPIVSVLALMCSSISLFGGDGEDDDDEDDPPAPPAAPGAPAAPAAPAAPGAQAAASPLGAMFGGNPVLSIARRLLDTAAEERGPFENQGVTTGKRTTTSHGYSKR